MMKILEVDVDDSKYTKTLVKKGVKAFTQKVVSALNKIKGVHEQRITAEKVDSYK